MNVFQYSNCYQFYGVQTYRCPRIYIYVYIYIYIFIYIYIASFWVQYHKILHEFVIFRETVRSSGIFRTNVIFCDTERKKLAIYVLLLAKSKNNNNLLRIRSEARWKRHVFIFMIYEEVFICIDHCFCNSNKILLLMSLSNKILLLMTL